MNYQTVLQNYLPVEQGDFMLKYEIDDRGYAIYSPEKGSFSCIELHGFSELTPWQLAFLLSLDMQQMKEQDEFSLSVCCKREKLLSYLFDVEESETTLKTKHVSGWQGYLMMDIHKPDKVRNVFQFHPETKERSPGKLHHPPSSNQVQGQNRNTSCGQGNADVLRFIGTYGLRKQKHHIKQ